MTRQCNKCKRTLELNKENFRLGCDGFWRRECRKCERQRRNTKYKKQKPKTRANKKVDPYKQAKKKRYAQLLKEYSKVLRILKRKKVKVNAPAWYVDKIIEEAEKFNRKTA